MKKTILIAVAMVATKAYAVPGGNTGYSFTPHNTPFTITGSMSFQDNNGPVHNCIVTMRANTSDRSAAAILSAIFSDSGDGSCLTVYEGHADRSWLLPIRAHTIHWGKALFGLDSKADKGTHCSSQFTMHIMKVAGQPTRLANAHVDGVKLASADGICRLKFDLTLSDGVTVTATPGE